ncbi:hypothetical protein [Porphyromonas sp. HMSC065F10]|uniref:hypothetical protein n=1 Tax=Porphyromonas sp. HMSC065F10 TaxID=1739394 RepID=UPI0008A2700F|nr:hypothetical protein [Porphyromonas sp. HMSC065F10]OFR38701.1 hypothetical protein HMPREF2890_02585 [Porphyromonas sp. HMSC065F10]
MGYLIIGIIIFVAIVCFVVLIFRIIGGYFSGLFGSAKEILTGNIVEGGCSCIIMLILGVLGIIAAVAFVTGIIEAMIE